MKRLFKLGGVALLSLSLFACSATPEQEEELPPPEPIITETEQPIIVEQPVAEPEPTGIYLPDGRFARGAVNDPSSPLAQKVIYFDFDSDRVRPEYVDVLNQHASYLATYGDIRVRLEGHTDERGSREYNIALGERRAKSIENMLLLSGVRAEQLSLVSYGEELPAALGHNEEAWGQNRRVEVVYELQ
jgi:peptidoglycan-associated lipoprotein